MNSNILPARPLFRVRNSTLGVLTSGVGAKGFGFLNQLLSTYLLAHALGEVGLENQMLAIAFVSWFSLTLGGATNSLPALIIACGKDDPAAARKLAKAGFFLAIASALVAVTVSLAIYEFGATNRSTAAPIATAVICNGLILSMCLADAVLYAQDRIVEFNILNAFGTLVSLVSTLFLAFNQGVAWQFAVAFFLSTMIPSLIGATLLWKEGEFEVALTAQEFAASVRRMMGGGLYSLGVAVALYCCSHLPLLILQAMNRIDAIAPVGTSSRLTSMMLSGLAVAYPLIFVRVSTALRDENWIAYRRWTRAGVYLAFAIVAIVAVIAVTVGNRMFLLWTDGAVGLPLDEAVGLSIYAGSMAMQTILLAITAPDPELYRRVRWWIWAEAPLAPALGTLLSYQYGAAGMLSGLGAGIWALIAVQLLVVVRRVRALRPGAPAPQAAAQ